MKVIIPVAGYGTRLWPLTKAVPKALLPMGEKPLLQWALEEAVESGLTDIIIVYSKEQTHMKRYLNFSKFDSPLLSKLIAQIRIEFVEQQVPLGLGDALLCCKPLIKQEAFAMVLPDNICLGKPGLSARLLDVYRIYNKSCVAVQRPDTTAGMEECFLFGEEEKSGIW